MANGSVSAHKIEQQHPPLVHCLQAAVAGPPAALIVLVNPNKRLARDIAHRDRRTLHDGAATRPLPWGRSLLYLLDQLQCRFDRHLVVPALRAGHKYL